MRDALLTTLGAAHIMPGVLRIMPAGGATLLARLHLEPAVLPAPLDPQPELLEACGMVPGATKIPCYRLFVDGEEVEVRPRRQRRGLTGGKAQRVRAKACAEGRPAAARPMSQ